MTQVSIEHATRRSLLFIGIVIAVAMVIIALV